MAVMRSSSILRWQDDEGDWCMMSNEADLREAIFVAESLSTAIINIEVEGVALPHTGKWVFYWEGPTEDEMKECRYWTCCTQTEQHGPCLGDNDSLPASSDSFSPAPAPAPPTPMPTVLGEESDIDCGAFGAIAAKVTAAAEKIHPLMHNATVKTKEIIYEAKERISGSEFVAQARPVALQAVVQAQNMIEQARPVAQNIIEQARPVAQQAAARAQNMIEQARPVAQNMIEQARPVAQQAVVRAQNMIEQAGHYYVACVDPVEPVVSADAPGASRAFSSVRDAVPSNVQAKYELAIRQMIGMGFVEADSLKALQTSNGNVAQAVDSLLSAEILAADFKTISVEVGPIWNQEHAVEVMTEYLRSHPGHSCTGHWWTTEPFKMSVLQIVMPRADAGQFESGQVVWRYPVKGWFSEWSNTCDEIMEMGFESKQQIMEALVKANGELKAAIKILVAAERRIRASAN